MAHTKLQLKTLSVLRALLRDVNARVDNRIGDPPVRDTSRFVPVAIFCSRVSDGRCCHTLRQRAFIDTECTAN